MRGGTRPSLPEQTAGVRRQTIHAIETGEYVPKTEVVLKLAQALEVTVDDLFSLPRGMEKAPESLTAEYISDVPPQKGQPVIGKIDSRWVGVPVTATSHYLPEADGIVDRVQRAQARAELGVFAKEEAARNRLVMARYDPASRLLTNIVGRISGVEIISAAASGRRALAWLKEGKVHVAGTHLEDAKTGEFNLPFIKREFPDGDFRVVTFARREAGLVVASGNPKRV